MNNPVTPPAPPMETVDITKIDDQKRIAESLLIDINDWCEKNYESGHRRHLGGSLIGRPCSRQLWYSFRWAKKSDFNSYDEEGNITRTAGQTMRLFQRGHKEEISFTEYLEGIGCRLEFTPENQARISDVGGHFGGSLDNVGYLPSRYGITDRILFEFKTANMANFNKIKRKIKKNDFAGIVKPVFPDVFPIYWSQVCIYGYKMQLKYVFFMIVDKNTDELHLEIVELDWEHGKTMLDKAAMIVTAKSAPPKISLHQTFFECRWCDFKNVCHNKELVDKNCRSCIHSTAADDKKWTCDLAPEGSNTIPENVIALGCPSHEGIK